MEETKKRPNRPAVPPATVALEAIPLGAPWDAQTNVDNTLTRRVGLVFFFVLLGVVL
jgi:hypothetical protein